MTVNQLTYARLMEDRRANQAKEAETHRSNLANESLGSATLDESRRHNVATEQHNVNVLEETKRSNVAKETETNRSNLAKEAETHRSNVAQEVETNRANQAREAETHRSNVAKEVETQRANVAKEELQAQQNAETIRANQAKEQAARDQLNQKYAELDQEYAMWWQGTLPVSQSQELVNKARALLTEAQTYETTTGIGFTWWDKVADMLEALVPG